MLTDSIQEYSRGLQITRPTKLGADAVIHVRYGTVGIGFVSWGSLDGKGRAIVFK